MAIFMNLLKVMVVCAAPYKVELFSALLGAVLGIFVWTLAIRLCNSFNSTSTATTSVGRQEISTPTSVNYHFTRQCNKSCGFCFHTAKTSYVASIEDMRRGLRMLAQKGMKKINFAGGEPFLEPKKLAQMCEFCKVDLKLESVSIISNGTLIKRSWLQDFGQYVDVLGVSCDSFDEETNILIGRGSGKNVEKLFTIRRWCRELNIKFKLNTVVLTYNWQEEMAETIAKLDPFRWKVFQVLPVEGENDASETEVALDAKKRNVKNLLITDEQFQDFCDRHKHLPCFVPETNKDMASSYLILDEYMRFLDKGAGEEKTSASILDIGVDKALEEVYFDEAAFQRRGGVYDWAVSKAEHAHAEGDMEDLFAETKDD